MKLSSHSIDPRDARRVANPEQTPHGHFTLYFYGAVLRVLAQAAAHFGTSEAAEERLPFLAGYLDEIAAQGLNGLSFGDAYTKWLERIDAWETSCKSRLPLVELRMKTGLTHDDLILLAEFGLPDEDSRFGFAFGAMLGGGGEKRATAPLLSGGWLGHATFDVRQSSHTLESLGLLEPAAPDSGELRPCPQVWNAVRTGAATLAHGHAQHSPLDDLPSLDTLVLPHEVRELCSRIPGAVSCGAAAAIIVRSLRHNGRRTLAAAIARLMGKGVLQVAPIADPNDRRWRSAATLACLLDAVILTAGESGPSDALALPELPAGLATLMVTLGSVGGVTGSLADKAITLRLPIPDWTARERLWRTSLGTSSGGLPRLRITTGNIVRAAKVARARNVLNGDQRANEEELRAALRTLERPGLEALARRVDTPSDWSQLSVPCDTLAELSALEARCRQRERLGGFVGAALAGLGPGVRALFKGPSGTGKTLAARMLAGTLGMDLYRVDLAAVVNKYIGETEKNLEKVFERAEELDIILLLDEGDALLTQRTGVQTANDRYANLETNYLLQRLESYDGILLVTTNAGDRIDTAFQRRMDVVIDFPLPDAPERWAIWQLHLPAAHNIDDDLMNAAVQRCMLSGGQIRNVALHASLLAVESDTVIQSTHLIDAIEREYRKQGAVSPLRARNGAH